MYAVAFWAPFVFPLPYQLPYQRASVLLAMAGQGDEPWEEYTPPPEEVAEYGRLWRMPADQRDLVYRWLKVERQKYHNHQLGRWLPPPLELVAPPTGYASRACPEGGATTSRGCRGHPSSWWLWYFRLSCKVCGEQRWFATAVYFPLVLNGIAGVCLAVSTGESTRISKYNAEPENQRQMNGIAYPEWMAFAVWFYPGMVFGDLYGFRNRNAVAQGSLADVLGELCRRHGITDLRPYVHVEPGAWVYGKLRRLLAICGIHLHCELISGLSYRRPASLDVFMSTNSPSSGMEPQLMALWNASYEDHNGIPVHFPSQDIWMYLPVWRSFGPSPDGNIMDYTAGTGMLAHVQRMTTLARPGDAIARGRIGNILGQLRPVLQPVPQPPVLRQPRAITDARMPQEEEQRARY